MECTAFQLAGALTEESVQEAVNEVAELVLSRAPGTPSSSAPAAGGVSGPGSAPSPAAQAAVSAAVSATGDHPILLKRPSYDLDMRSVGACDKGIETGVLTAPL